jgi:D-glycero-alpha-D-manno-heptose 1-phosphate guanylyltransferase
MEGFNQCEITKEAIILAGGLGTRLRDVVPDLPKCMANVAGRPFLSYVIDSLRAEGIQRFIFSLGYKAEIIEKYLKESYSTLDYVTVIEKEPLGTGGAIRLACTKATEKNVLIANGDTLFKIGLKQIGQFHNANQAVCTLALKPMKQFDRYGVVELEDDGQIKSFHEKKFYEAGLINGGIYLLNRESFLKLPYPEQFSFETDYLEKYAGAGKLFGIIQQGYFIDIGIPEDFEKAQSDLTISKNDLKSIDRNWTLFLDRDGVINEERVGEYVLNWNEFVFSEGTLEALKILANKFDRIILITNQRGIGKGLMTENDLQNIHNEMQKVITESGGRIDKLYYCTEVDSKCFDRKPNPGMALRALNDFETIDFSKSIMVGNKPSDMRFGRSLGMLTIFVTSTNPHQPFPHLDIDLRFASLLEFANSI